MEGTGVEQRLSLVTLGVADLDRSVAFYEGLGWARSLRAAAGVAFFQLGGIGLSLYPADDLAADAGLPPFHNEGSGGGFRGVTLAHNVRAREEVDRVAAVLAGLGGTMVKPPEEKGWGGYGAYVLDPDGHAWEIAWNPGFPLGEDGTIRIPE